MQPNDILRRYFTWTVMALIGCERCGRTEPPLKYIKKWAPSTQDIALFLHSSTGMLMALKKKIESVVAACSASAY